jgi:hypothetical protein
VHWGEVGIAQVYKELKCGIWERNSSEKWNELLVVDIRIKLLTPVVQVRLCNLDFLRKNKIFNNNT